MLLLLLLTCSCYVTCDYLKRSHNEQGGTYYHCVSKKRKTLHRHSTPNYRKMSGADSTKELELLSQRNTTILTELWLLVQYAL